MPIGGLPPDLLAPPAGCRFKSRCQRRQAKCEEDPPLMVTAPIRGLSPGMGVDMLGIAFVVVALGGMGNVLGAIAAGLLIGVAQAVVAAYWTEASVASSPTAADTKRRGLGEAGNTATTVIWIIFIADFLVKLILAPRKLEYLRSSWLTALSLLLPALRVLRFVRVVRLARLARAARGVRLARVLTSLNRGMRALRAGMRRRGAGYAALLTLIVALVGAAGMYALEGPEDGGTFQSYGHALWWTAMLLSSMGSDYWPQTPEGRLLCLLLSIYGFGVFGYLTATISSFFIGRDAEEKDAPLAGADDVALLRQQLVEHVEQLGHAGAGAGRDEADRHQVALAQALFEGVVQFLAGQAFLAFLQVTAHHRLVDLHHLVDDALVGLGHAGEIGPVALRRVEAVDHRGAVTNAGS